MNSLALPLHHCQSCDLQFWYPLRAPGREWYEDDTYYAVRNLLIPETLSLEEYKKRHPDKKFDVITFFEVLEHQTDPREFVEKVRGLLAPDGYIALSVPNRERWAKLPPMNDSPPNHFTRWNCRVLGSFLRGCGFSIVELSEEPFTIRAGRQVVTGRFNNSKNRILVAGLKASSDGINRERKAGFIREVFRVMFMLWRVFTFLPSLLVFLYARWSVRKSFSIYCLAKMRNSLNSGSKETI